MYNEPLLCVTNNGYASQFFQIGRGIRQGCPISALLFLLVAESMADKIRMSNKIRGIDIKGVTVTISQLADDTTLFLNDQSSLKNVLLLLSHFEKCAGLKVNKEKSEAIVLGKHVEDVRYICGINVATKPIKTLGVWITKDCDNISVINFEERVEKLKNLLNMWKQRNLSLNGKVTIVNSLALSQIMYVASVLYVPPDIINNVNKLIFSFLWPKKVHVKQKSVIAPIVHGGLRMPDFGCKVKACKVMWVKRLLSNATAAHFAQVFGLPLKFADMCHLNYDVKFLKQYVSPFYKQVLKYWYELQQLSKCIKSSDIRSQLIWFNTNILVNDDTLFVQSLYDKSLKYINDILDTKGSFLPIDVLNKKFDCNINVMSYNSIKDAIPKQWRIELKESHPMCICKELKVKLRNAQKEIKLVTNKDIYWTFIGAIMEPPTAVSKWEEIYTDIDFDWEYIFSISYIIARETSIRSLQYKILHRFFPCNYTLNKWYPNNSMNCNVCNEVDTLEHYFCKCKTVEHFWNSFFKWWFSATQMKLHLSCIDVLFGIYNPNGCILIDSYNYCILLAKFFIYRQKQDDKECSFYLYQIMLKNRLDAEYMLSNGNDTVNTFNEKWSEIYENL